MPFYMRCDHSGFFSCGLPGYESTVKVGDYPPRISMLRGVSSKVDSKENVRTTGYCYPIYSIYYLTLVCFPVPLVPDNSYPSIGYCRKP